MHFEFRMMFLFVVIPQCMSVSNSGQCPNLKSDIKSIRKRRHLVFPDGSNFVLAINPCRKSTTVRLLHVGHDGRNPTQKNLTMDFAKTFMTHAPSGWFLTMDIDVSYPLPDQKMVSAHLRRKLHHRQKREFWERIRDALNLHNMNGHSCVMRSICEARLHLAPPGKSLVNDLLRAIFTAPIEEKEFTEEFGDAYNDLSDPNLCEREHECPFSILNFILAFNKKKK